MALGFPAAAALLAVLWAAGPGPVGGLNPVELAVLLAAVALAEQVELPITGRTTYTFSTPLVVLAAVLGGPLTGLAAGALAGAAMTGAVWRRRLAYSGLCAIQGFVAGLVGLAAHGTESALIAVSLAAMLAVFAISLGGRVLIFLDRGVPDPVRNALDGCAAEAIETTMAVPLVALLALSFETTSILALTTVLSLLAGLRLLHTMRQRHDSALSAALSKALTDSVTGAPNRLAFSDALEREHARIVRGTLPAGLFMLDIDRFKRVNDDHGHAVGDAVLTEIVARLQRALRRSDLVARWGGEELAVLAPELADPEEAGAFGERLRAAVGRRGMTIDGVHLHVTVSVGGTLLDGSVPVDAALRRADAALYRAKIRRNDVVVDGEWVAASTVGAFA